MNSEKFFFYLQSAIVGAVLLASVFASIAYFRRSRSTPAPYFSVREAVEDRLAPRQVSRFVSPFDLRLQPLNEKFAEASGWVEYTTASGQISTQWFTCVVGTGQRLRPVANLKMFHEDPSRNR